jgi:GLPGLI family protein
MKKYTTILLMLLLATGAYAQNVRFVTQGTIVYEKKVNIYALMKEEIKKNPNETYYVKIFEEYQKNQPQFKVLKSILNFNKSHSLFTPEDESIAQSTWNDFTITKQPNTILTNIDNNTSIIQKKVFEETYLVKDTTRKINWKITDEIRTIAGYDCRRANALIMDSIYVVAFYTDEIPVSGGPETFTGLPGMILGVALPYEHVTWFATSVSDQPITDDKLKAPTKGKPVTSTQLFTILKSALKDWGTYANESFKALML